MDYAKQFEINKKYLMKNCGMEDFCFGLGSDFDIRVAEDECAFHVVIDENSQFYFLKYQNLDYDQILNADSLKLKLPVGINVFKVLNTILRESGKCGFDNRMYIGISSAKELVALMHVCDLEEILSKGKIMFLLGELQIGVQNFEGSQTEERKLHFSELEDLIFLYQPQSCGYEFVRDVILKNDFVVYADGWTLHRKLEEFETKIGDSGFFKKLFLDTQFRISGVKFLQELLKYQKLLLQSGFDCASILNIFCDRMLTENSLSVSDLFKCLFLCKYIADKPDRNKRIKPIIVYFPDHYQRFMDYYINIQKDFHRVLYFRTIRNPVIRSIRAYEYIKKNNLYYFVNYLDVLFEELFFDEFSIRQGKSYAMRFEDLKKSPQIMVKKMCDLFRIPFEDKMLQDKETFSTKALNPQLDKVFTEQDIEMLQVLYNDILDYYGYEKVENYMFCEELLNYTFQFEKELADILVIDEELLRMEIKRRMKKVLTGERVGFPYWLRCEVDEYGTQVGDKG